MSNNEDEKNVLDIYYDIKEGRVKLAQKKTSEASNILCSYLAMQRTMYLVFQHTHWKFNKYGNHLLFERLYKDVIELIDATAEKIIGIFGNEALAHDEQLEIITGMYNKYKSDDHMKNSLDVTKDFLIVSKRVYDQIKEMNDMTLGLDDMIMSQSNEVEEYIYLLNRANQSNQS